MDTDVFGADMAIASEVTESEKLYEKVLKDLRDAEGLKLISDVYTKLYDSYYKQKEQNNEQQKEIDKLKNKLVRFDDIVSENQAEKNELERTIVSLNAQVEEAKALADAMHSRELASVESLDTIKKTVARLEKELDAIKRAGDDDAGPTSAVKEKEKFEKEKLRLQNELDNALLKLKNTTLYMEEVELKANQNEEAISKLEEALEEADNNAVRTGRLVEHLKGEEASLKNIVEFRNGTIKDLNASIGRLEINLERREKQFRDTCAKLQRAIAEQEAATAKAKEFREKWEFTKKEKEQISTTLTDTNRDLKDCNADGTKLRTSISNLQKTIVANAKRYQLLEYAKIDVENERGRLRQQVCVMEREIMLSKKQAESDKRDIENLQREKDITLKNMQKIENEALENLNMLTLQAQRMKQVEHELDVTTKQVNKQRLMIRQYEKDKDRMLEETIALNEKIDELSEEIRMRNHEILDLKKALREEVMNTRKLTVSLDATRAERNMLAKTNTECIDEILDLKQKLKMLAYQIEQLKEDISSKESLLKTNEAVISKYHKRVEMLKLEVQNGVTKLNEAKADIAALRQEEARLIRIIQENDIIKAKLTKEMEGLMNERDVIGAQLVRRNDEISLLYEKIRILEITLQRGERQYEIRVDDIRLLRLEILRLRKEKNLLSKGIENMTDLRLEVFNLERELCRERLRVRALEEALETPLNVHRWRKLQGVDPESVKLTQKLRVTQKKILAQSEMLVLKDRELKETKNLYNAVKDMLALQPSPEIKMTLNRTQRALAQRTSKLKCILTELNMREKQVSDLRLELKKVNDEFTEFKKKYFDMKHVIDTGTALSTQPPETSVNMEECLCENKPQPKCVC